MRAQPGEPGYSPCGPSWPLHVPWLSCNRPSGAHTRCPDTVQAQEEEAGIGSSPGGCSCSSLRTQLECAPAGSNSINVTSWGAEKKPPEKPQESMNLWEPPSLLVRCNSCSPISTVVLVLVLLRALRDFLKQHREECLLPAVLAVSATSRWFLASTRRPRLSQGT